MINNNIDINVTSSAIYKIKKLLINKNKNTKFRIYIENGGCKGFKYNFYLDETINKNDILIKKNDIHIIIDKISIQYLNKCTLDYKKSLINSKFIIINPNTKISCNCGDSFSI